MTDEPTEILPEPDDTEQWETEHTEPEETDPVTMEQAVTKQRSWTAGLHQLSIGHLVMGVAFLGLFVTWILVESGASWSELQWMLPVPFVAAGLVGLVAAAPRLRGPADRPTTPPTT